MISYKYDPMIDHIHTHIYDQFDQNMIILFFIKIPVNCKDDEEVATAKEADEQCEP